MSRVTPTPSPHLLPQKTPKVPVPSRTPHLHHAELYYLPELLPCLKNKHLLLWERKNHFLPTF